MYGFKLGIIIPVVFEYVLHKLRNAIQGPHSHTIAHTYTHTQTNTHNHTHTHTLTHTYSHAHSMFLLKRPTGKLDNVLNCTLPGFNLMSS